MRFKSRSIRNLLIAGGAALSIVLVGSCDKGCKLQPKDGSIIVGEGEACEYKDTTGGGGGEQPVGDPVVLTSPITTNTTLKDLGIAVDYVFNGNGLLAVKNNATLTIEPGVTIQFTNTGGGIEITDGATIVAIGTAEKHIQFVGTKTTKDAWNGMTINSNTENELRYCDFINGGKLSNGPYAVLNLNGASVGISHCRLSGGMMNGIRMSNGDGRSCVLTTFDNNVIEGMEQSPIRTTAYGFVALGKLDLTSNLADNVNPYIYVDCPNTLTADATLNETSVPYYLSYPVAELRAKLTINAGVTIYMPENGNFINGGVSNANGNLMILGTAEKPVTFTRLPNSVYHWNCIVIDRLAGSVIEHCNIDYSGVGAGTSVTKAAFYLGGSNTSLTMRNVHISNSANFGIHLASGYGLTHSNVTFANNASGNVRYNNITYNSLDELP
jgi:hypothetical protein